jgi:signal transduction histidine kinase
MGLLLRQPMNFDATQRRAMFSWLFVGALLILCGVLGVLQYRWIGEVSEAARDRLRGSLQANLERLNTDLSARIASGIRNFMPAAPTAATHPAAEIGTRYRAWAAADRHAGMIAGLTVVDTHQDPPALYRIDLATGAASTMDWPGEWRRLREWLMERPGPDGRGGRGFPGPRPFEGPDPGGPLSIEVPIIVRAEDGAPPAPGMRDAGWLIVSLDLPYLRDTLLQDVLHSHLGTGGTLDYSVEVVSRTEPETIVYRSDPGAPRRVSANPDGSIGLLGSVSESFFGRGGGRDGRRRNGGRGPDFAARGPEFGGRGDFGGRGRGPGDAPRWILFVRHKAGSLEAVVSQARWRNLAVTAGVLLLLLATVAALVRYTRRAQRLAELQMDFVAGVSHELRTPLTVIHTAAYNLRGKLAANAAHVERYGALIQQESGRLKDLVEQVLTFAGAKAGNVVQRREPLAVEAVIEEAMQSSRPLLNGAHCEVETHIAPGLPLVLGDAITLRHALQNLLGNAVKYGAEGGNWIGVYASRTGDDNAPAVEIRVADRGPGIPEDEQAQVFDPFFRGRRALHDQVHGTGLGLSLVKQIVEAHGGQVTVKSRPMEGTEFILRIPAAPPEYQDEFANTVG